MARYRRQGKKTRRTRRLLEDGFATPGANEAILRLRAQQEDSQATQQLDDDIAAHPDVCVADDIVELFVSGIHHASTPEYAVQQLQQYFCEARTYGTPGHRDLRRLNLHSGDLAPAQAVLACRSGPRPGCAFVEVANEAVAEFFCCASFDGEGAGVNCAPPNGRPRRVYIKRNGSKRRDSRGASAAVRVQGLEVRRVSVVDLDARERRAAVVLLNEKRARGAPVYPARTLWDCNIEMADIDLKARTVELEQHRPNPDSEHLVHLSIELRTIKHFAIFDIEGHPEPCLALRLRRPPTLDTCPAPDVGSNADLGLLAEAIAAILTGSPYGASAFARSTDPSTHEAFASPTAWLCLHFDSRAAFRAAEDQLRSFKIRFSDLLVLTMHGSQHAHVCDGFSHEIPRTLAPLTELDLADAGDTAFQISYLLDLLLVHGNLRAADVPDVLRTLRTLRQWGFIRSYREILASLAEEAPAFHRCNDGDFVITRVGRAVHVIDLTDDSPGAAAAAADVAADCSGARNGQDEESAKDGHALDGEGSEEEPVAQEHTEEEEGIIYPRRVIVTPLRVLLYAAVPEVSNRVLRKYSRFGDRFLRVTFANERLGPTSAVELSDAVCERIRTLLLDGLSVGNRRFVFLAFSNSQLRENSCWMYCEDGAGVDGAPTADDIRQSVGELSALRVPSKFAARLGQAFSTTFKTFDFQPHDICNLPDVFAPNGDLYSDGVGVITAVGMQKVVQHLPARMRRQLAGALPSAIQIRLGGCKGMLTLWDGVEGMAPGALVGIRPSMKKFESADLAVEVCTLAQPMPAAINRQLIMALLSLGVADSVFEEKFHEHVQQLDKLVSGGTDSLTVLRAMGAYAAHGLHGVGVAQGSLAACMIEAGISPRDDAFLLSLCQAYRTFALKSITEKCRIMLKDGVNLIGVMDESGTLPPGTFWASWDRTYGRRSPTNPEGVPDSQALAPGTRTIVTRFPCISPADVRVLRAADPSTLPAAVTSLTNVVVFPQLGESPEPCKMAGGDLDGDIYLLTWDAALVPEREADAEDYAPARQPVEKADGVKVEDIVEFQMNYMKNDQLGRIANGHLAIADFATGEAGERVFSNNEKCNELVHLHSTAVDFAKTGVPVNHAEVTFVLKGLPTPDYLGGPDRSTSVIGRITRAAKERTAACGGLPQPAGERLGRLVRHADPDLLLELRRPFLRDADVMLDDWSYDIGQLMQRFGTEDVGEVFSGRVRRFNGMAAGRERYADHQTQLETALAAIVERYQRWWFPDVEPAAARVAINPENRDDITCLGPGYAANGKRVGAQQPLELEPGTLQEMLCAASALYAAAYRPDDRRWVQEHLIRRACPWRVAPRLLLQLKLWSSEQRKALGAPG